MTEIPTAGTFRLDGMLQASLGGNEETADRLQSWVKDARKMGLHFHLQLEGNGFSLLGAPQTCKTSTLGGRDLSDLMQDALDSLLDLMPGPGPQGTLSTIRSEEFRPGIVVRTLYSVGVDGKISVEQRSLDIKTAEAPPEFNPVSLRKYALPGLVALLLGLFVSSFFIDYRKLFQEARDQVAPFNKEEVTLDTASLGDVVAVKLVDVDSRRSALILEINRGPGWDRAGQSKPSDQVSWREFLINQAVHTGKLTVELRSKDGVVLSRGEISLEALREKSKAEVAVVARVRDRLATVVIRP